MNRKIRAIALAALAPLGCSLIRPDRLPEGGLEQLGQALSPLKGTGTGAAPGPRPEGDGQLVLPRRNALKVMIAARPVDDPVLRRAVWRMADEQAVDPETRRTLQANGLRLGVVEGRLPTEVEAILDQELQPPDRIDPVILALPDGDPELIQVGPSAPVDRLSLFLNRGGRADGKDFEQARGFFRLTATQRDDPPGIVLRIVPEIHHGPVQSRFDVAPETGPYSPLEFRVIDGQAQDTLRELAAEVPIRPGQVLVLGCWPDRLRSLGHFLMTDVEPGSDRTLQKVIFLWATPINSTEIPWVEPVTPPRRLRPVDPPEMDGDGEGGR